MITGDEILAALEIRQEREYRKKRLSALDIEEPTISGFYDKYTVDGDQVYVPTVWPYDEAMKYLEDVWLKTHALRELL